MMNLINNFLNKKAVILAGLVVLAALSISDLAGSFPLFSNTWKIVISVVVILYLTGIVAAWLLLFRGLDITRLRLFRNRLGFPARWIIVVLLIVLMSFFLLYTRPGSYFQGDYFRLSIYLLSTAVTAFLICTREEEYFGLREVFIASGLVGMLYSVGNYLTDVTPNPFSYFWSEGNRLYDYSLIFGKYLYDYTGILEPNYNSPGRYGLWGIWFLVPGLSITFHRLWNAVLWTATPFILGILLTKKITVSWLRWGLVMWVSLFILVGPVYPTLLVALCLLTLTVWSDKVWLRATGVVLAAIFASMSRYFWVVVPGAWIVLFDLFFHYPFRKGTWFRRLLPTVMWGLLGVLPGLYFAFNQLFSAKTPFEGNQPLLWYRLLPNATYPLGIILNFLIGFSPILVLFTWLILKKKVHLDGWQKIAVFLALTGFVVAGFVASTKIGGGSNLHNLDMFIVTMALLTVIFVMRYFIEHPIRIETWPRWVWLVGVIVMLTPGWIAMRVGFMRVDPPADIIRQTLDLIQYEAEKGQKTGDVLFLDQRQLLTFGEIKGIRLLPEYEKKYMMDQAMGDNGQYFEQFHADLANHRFSLIITEPLTTDIKSQKRGFSEENNAYVRWVAEPIDKYYQPAYTIREVGVQLLVPR
jgi:hypothetical protein